jgi:hypothetical protein
MNTFPGWQALSRNVKRGERAILLCMPITRSTRKLQDMNDMNETNGENDDHTYTSFMYKARWFVISQTEGNDFALPELPEWNADRALAALDIRRIAFTSQDGNCQGYAKKNQIAINPVAQLPHKTLFHETAHILLGHTREADFTDAERTPRNLREVEAEAVALLCCEALNLEGADYCRGYIQNWLFQPIGHKSEAIPEKSAQKIFRAADQIIRAGRQTVDIAV